MLNHGPKRNDVEHFEKAGSGFKIQEEPKPRVVFLQYYTCITMQDLADTSEARIRFGEAIIATG